MPRIVPITPHEYPFPLNWILNLRYNFRVRHGKPAHVTYRGMFYAYSGNIKMPSVDRIIFSNDKDPLNFEPRNDSL